MLPTTVELEIFFHQQQILGHIIRTVYRLHIEQSLLRCAYGVVCCLLAPELRDSPSLGEAEFLESR